MRINLKEKSYDVTSENDLKNKIPYYAIDENRIILYNARRPDQTNQSNSMLEKAINEIVKKKTVA